MQIQTLPPRSAHPNSLSPRLIPLHRVAQRFAPPHPPIKHTPLPPPQAPAPSPAQKPPPSTPRSPPPPKSQALPAPNTPPPITTTSNRALISAASYSVCDFSVPSVISVLNSFLFL